MNDALNGVLRLSGALTNKKAERKWCERKAERIKFYRYLKFPNSASSHRKNPAHASIEHLYGLNKRAWDTDQTPFFKTPKWNLAEILGEDAARSTIEWLVIAISSLFKPIYWKMLHVVPNDASFEFELLT